MHDILIIGTGPAGITAGIFAVRRSLNTILLGDPLSLPTMTEATIVDDYPCIPNIEGPKLMEKFLEHAKTMGIEIREEKALEIKKSKRGFTVKTERQTYETKTIIIATGAKHRNVMVPGEKEFVGRGVSYCANCDGPLFKGKKTVVIGGGDTALTYALLLDQIGADTTIMHRRDEFRGVEHFQRMVFDSKIKIMWNTIPKEIKGGKFVNSIVVENVKTKKQEEIKTDGVFVAIGTVPTSELAKNVGVGLDEVGFIKVDREQKTNVPGIFAAGDCCNNPSKRIVTACGDGSIAAEAAALYIKEMEK